jgi:hypothetical protein
MRKQSARAPLVTLVIGGLLLGGCATSNTAAPAVAPATAAVITPAATPTVKAAPSGGAAVTSTTAPTTAPAAAPTDTAVSPAQEASPTAVATAEQPAAPETNPAGDIPDTQVFVRYTSPAGGYTLEVPEGWARTTDGAGVRFVDKLDGVQVALTGAAAAPTAATVRAGAAAALERSGRAVKVNKVRDVKLPAGPAVLIEYSSNSEPDPVTGKQVRLEDNAYLFFRGGNLATLTLWAPLGADNVDQWLQMARSFRWR